MPDADWPAISKAFVEALGLQWNPLTTRIKSHDWQAELCTASGHSLLGIDNAGRGLSGLDALPAVMAADLEANWEVLGEPIQSAMRALGAQGVAGMENPYERLKELTRGRRITGEDLREFVLGLGLPPEVEKRSLEMTPQTYVGLAPQLVDYLG